MLLKIQTRRWTVSLAAACSLVATGLSPVSVFSQTLPATPPTAPTAAPLSATATRPDAATRAHRADVVYASGMLSVNASNSSLNQILRDISKATGMKITGGVRDERVFGHYGPATPGDILVTLIDGNSTNMLLRQASDASPEELILTPRAGGASPPNPNAPGFDSGSDDSEQPLPPQLVVPNLPNPSVSNGGRPTGPISIPQPANNVNGSSLNVTPTASQIPTTNSVPTDSLPTPSTTPASVGIVDTPNPPASGTVNPASPNGVRTPEEIYEQLQKLRQQQNKTPQ